MIEAKFPPFSSPPSAEQFISYADEMCKGRDHFIKIAAASDTYCAKGGVGGPVKTSNGCSAIPSVFHPEYKDESMIETSNGCSAIPPSILRGNQVGGDHYENMKIQPWDAAREWSTVEEYIGYHVITAVSYLARHKLKGGLQDIKKAHHHLSELIRYLETDTEYPY